MNDSIKKIMIIIILSFMFLFIDVKAACSYDAEIKQYASYAQESMKETGIHASLILAQSIVESKLGSSSSTMGIKLGGVETILKNDPNFDTKNANNKALCASKNGNWSDTIEEINGISYDAVACFKKANDLATSLRNQGGWLLSNWANKKNIAKETTLLGQLHSLRNNPNAVYATDSDYVCELINQINSCDLTKYDSGISYSGRGVTITGSYNSNLSNQNCSYSSTSSINSNINNTDNYEHFGTSYTGDITQGWIYKRFEFSETFNHELPDYMAESNINDIIDIIFNRAKTSYFSVLSNMSGLIGNIDAGSFDSWLQCNSNWGDIHLGSSSYTICSAGCAATSIAIQIARSGVPLSLNGNLNPGSFVSVLNQNGGFTSGGDIYWGKASVVAPNFQFNSSVGLKGNSSSKIATLANYLSSGNNYIVAHVNGSKNGTTSNHWVAVTGVTNSDVMMIDPSGRGISLNSAYGLDYLDDIRIYTVK